MPMLTWKGYLMQLALLASVPTVPYQIPDMFTNGQLPITVAKVANVWTNSFNPATYRTAGTVRYVRTTGDDATGTGSAGNPYRNPQAAINAAVTGDIIDLGAGRFENITVNNKILWMRGVAGQTFVGKTLTELEITWGVFDAVNKRQTCTVTSGGSISGFVDLNSIDAYFVFGVTLSATSVADIATLQAGGMGGVERTSTMVGAFDQRDLTGSGSSTIIAWSSNAPKAQVLQGTARVMSEDIFFVGGGDAASTGLGDASAQTVATTATRIIYSATGAAGHLGAHGEVLNCDGTSILAFCHIRGCRVAGSDVVDYASQPNTCRFAEINITVSGAAYSGADNASTAHGSAGIRVNSRYIGGARIVHDVGDTMIGIFNCDLDTEAWGASDTQLLVGSDSNTAYTSVFIDQVRFNGVPTTRNVTVFSGGTAPTSLTVYDDSLTGKSTAGVIYDRSAGYSPVAKRFYDIHAYTIGNLFQNTGGTVPVVNDGDPVLRINNVGDPGTYILCTNIRYKTDGALCWFENNGAANTSKFEVNGIGKLEKVHLILVVDANDTACVMAGIGASHYFDARIGSGAILRTLYAGLPTYRVNKVALAGGNAAIASGAGGVNALAFTGGTKVVTIKGTDENWDGWRKGITAGYGGSLGIDGRIYSITCERDIGDTPLGVEESTLALRGGLTV
jgi:hypothetical protein